MKVKLTAPQGTLLDIVCAKLKRTIRPSSIVPSIKIDHEYYLRQTETRHGTLKSKLKL